MITKYMMKSKTKRDPSVREEREARFAFLDFRRAKRANIWAFCDMKMTEIYKFGVAKYNYIRVKFDIIV